MPYDPQHDDLPPSNAGRDYRAQTRVSAAAAMIVGALLLVAISGFVYFFAGIGYRSVANHEVPFSQAPATNVEPMPETTGSAASPPPGREPMAEPEAIPVD